ncbi:helix-turn-helix domain-containing protein [Lolliginicoccus suaedae]|uniref:helix-turn-helix domain-containing protein n=1 Tax=Lolliginicoccus suaedae TaxID=2605429 RepID=UPI0011EF7E63|nr:helix-turn-helix domain-containing protein [Lolliginicoccus suaedae]
MADSIAALDAARAAVKGAEERRDRAVVAMIAAGRSQREVAAMLGVSQPAIFKIVRKVQEASK